MASLTPALAVSSCGCFLPDLTRFTRLQCGGARHAHCMSFLEKGCQRADHPISVDPANSIRRLGFTRWYERRLIEGHVWLVCALLCVIVALVCLEELKFRDSAMRVFMNLSTMLATFAVGWYGLDRFFKILREVILISERATCTGCGTYARFALISQYRAKCKKCGHEWKLLDPDAGA